MTGNPQGPDAAAQEVPQRLSRLEEAQTFADREQEQLSAQLTALQARLGELTARLARIEASLGGLAERIDSRPASGATPRGEDAVD